MADFNEKFRVVMLQGAKGDAYDDTQLRQDINEMLANTPYIKYTEDDGFELPIYTINDNSITAYSCWSSAKTTEEIANIIDDNDDALYSETTTRSAKSITDSFDAYANHIGGLALRISNLETDDEVIKPKISALETAVTKLNTKAFNYSSNNEIMIDTTKYNHMMIITTNRIAFVILNSTFPSSAGTNITLNCLIGNNIMVNSYSKSNNNLSITFNSSSLANFCYMLSE